MYQSDTWVVPSGLTLGTNSVTTLSRIDRASADSLVTRSYANCGAVWVGATSVEWMPKSTQATALPWLASSLAALSLMPAWDRSREMRANRSRLARLAGEETIAMTWSRPSDVVPRSTMRIRSLARSSARKYRVICS